MTALAQENEELPHASVQNPVLREYFMQQYRTFHPQERGVSTPEVWAERYVDLRVADFLEKVRENLDELARDRLLLVRIRDGRTAFGEDQERSKVLSEATGRLKENANRLRKMLALVFSELKSKQDFDVDLEGCSLTECSRAIDLLERELVLAQKEIEDYFFGTTSTVRIDQLQNQNMLIRLYQAQQVAKELEAVFSR